MKPTAANPLTLGTTQFCPPPAAASGVDLSWVDAVMEAPAGSLGSFAGYDLLKVIARGGMGIVYHARSVESGHEVALKILPGGRLLAPEVAQRFINEAETMASLHHPGILPVYDAGEWNGTLFYTMKLATGGSLADRLADYAGQWERISEVVAQVAEVVQFAHDAGVIHRDLKPANIVFDAEGHPYLCDFGIAKLLHDDAGLTQECSLIGTPHYMPPELVQTNGSGPTTLSDVWSLGVILYELLAGSRPFNGESPAKIMRKVEEDYPPPLRQAPRDLAVVATHALSKRPAERYPRAMDLADDLRRWLQAEPILAKPQHTSRIAWPWVHQSTVLSTVLTLLLFGMVLSWPDAQPQTEGVAVERLGRPDRPPMSQSVGRPSNQIPRPRKAPALTLPPRHRRDVAQLQDPSAVSIPTLAY